MLKVESVAATGEDAISLRCGARIFASDGDFLQTSVWYASVHCSRDVATEPKVSGERPLHLESPAGPLVRMKTTQRPRNRQPDVQIALPCGGRYALSNGIGQPLIIACAEAPDQGGADRSNLFEKAGEWYAKRLVGLLDKLGTSK